MSPLTPARRATPEYLDDPATDPSVLAASGGEIAQCNRLFGGTRALLAELAPLWTSLRPAASLLDVGCGVGDLPAAARHAAEANGVALRVVGLDRRALLAARARTRVTEVVVGDAFALPFADASFDIVTTCQVMHHFTNASIPAFARELTRVARGRVIVSDLRRSWVAACGIWIASWPLGFNRITRHDGFVSILKGFEPAELREALHAATGSDVRVTARRAFRITASWNPTAS